MVYDEYRAIRLELVTLNTMFGVAWLVRMAPAGFPRSSPVCPLQWSGRFLGTTGQDPSVCKSNMFTSSGFPFIKLGYILFIPLKWSIIFLQSWTSTVVFSNSTGSFVTNCRFSPIIGPLVSLSLVGEGERVKFRDTQVSNLARGGWKWREKSGGFLLCPRNISVRVLGNFKVYYMGSMFLSMKEKTS